MLHGTNDQVQYNSSARGHTLPNYNDSDWLVGRRRQWKIVRARYRTCSKKTESECEQNLHCKKCNVDNTKSTLVLANYSKNNRNCKLTTLDTAQQ